MPRRLLPDQLFGETANCSVVRMSNEAMLQTQMKNEHERWKLIKELKQLISNEKAARLHTRRELEMLREEYTKMIAYGRVCKEYGFGKYDPQLNKRQTTNKTDDENNTIFSRQTSLCSTQLPDIDDAPGYVRILKRNPVRRSKSDLSDSRRPADNLYSRTRFSSIAESDISDISTTLDDRNIDTECQENEMKPIPEENQTNNNEKEEEEEQKIASALSSILAIKLQALVMWKQKIHKKPERVASERPRFVRKMTTVGESPPSTNIRAPVTRPSSLLPGECKTVFEMKKFMEREVSNQICVLSSPKKDRAKMDKMIEKARLPQLIERRKTTSAIFRDFRTYKESLQRRKLDVNTLEQNGQEVNVLSQIKPEVKRLNAKDLKTLLEASILEDNVSEKSASPDDLSVVH